MGISMVISIITIFLLTAISYSIWLVFGKDTKVEPSYSIVVPSKRNSAEFEVEYKGFASSKAVSSLIYYLATKGYILIEGSTMNYSLTKLKEYEGKNFSEKNIMNALFCSKNVVTVEDLEKSEIFYKRSINVIKSLNKIQNFLFDKNACTPEKITILFLCIIGIIITMIYAAGNYSFTLLTGNFAPYMWSVIAAASVIAFAAASKNLPVIFFVSIFGSLVLLYPLYVIITNVPNFAINSLVIFWGIICLTVSGVCLKNMPKRNKKGDKVLSEILGLKNFINSSEIKKAVKYYKENPNYFYDMLPFAYVLDSSENWFGKMEEENSSQPSWFKGQFNNYNFVELAGMIENILDFKNGGSFNE